MVRRFFMCSLTLAVAQVASVAWADDAETLTLEPSSSWSVEFADEKCRLSRVFGTGDNLHVLFFEQWAPSDSFVFTAAGPTFKGYYGKRKITVDFGANRSEELAPTFFGEVPGVGSALIYSDMRHKKTPPAPTGLVFVPASGLAALDIEEASKIEFLAIARAGRKTRFNAGNLAKPFEVLNTCTEDLLESWGLDLEQHRTARSRPVWLNQQDIAQAIQQAYPVEALTRGEQGTKVVRVIVDTNGRVTRCILEQATIAEAINAPICKEMARALFAPARDAQGNPMQSFYMTTVSYMIG